MATRLSVTLQGLPACSVAALSTGKVVECMWALRRVPGIHIREGNVGYNSRTTTERLPVRERQKSRRDVWRALGVNGQKKVYHPDEGYLNSVDTSRIDKHGARYGCVNPGTRKRPRDLAANKIE
ncbi:hypothetical protein FA13DRAFT_814870 [Coprinellus micaceus]|uniref:Uncharacterized protein n=1 Tax=Coprinellus micaceus TaxID=71717 RepID=A0A4Y7T2G0_COPMI|nr:hypothetical protein FA13DRAFT_814870 [Coprinellus micaceus]